MKNMFLGSLREDFFFQYPHSLLVNNHSDCIYILTLLHAIMEQYNSLKRVIKSNLH